MAYCAIYVYFYFIFQLTEPVAPQFERSEQAPYYVFVDHSSSMLADCEHDNKTSDNKIKNENYAGDSSHVNDKNIIVDFRVEAIERSGSTASDTGRKAIQFDIN